MPKDMPNLSAKDAPDLGSFNWEDPLLLEQQLSDEERMIRDSARAYAQEKLQPRIKTAFNEERVEPEIFKEMGAMGLLGTTIPMWLLAVRVPSRTPFLVLGLPVGLPQREKATL